VGRVRSSVRVIAALAFALAQPPPAQGQAVPEYELKAAYVYNFVQLTEWPAGALGAADAPFAVCVMGAIAPARSIEALHGKRVFERRIEVRALHKAASARACQVLFVSGGELARMGEIVAALAEAPVLTVADSDEPRPGAAAITLAPHGARIGFHVNLAAAKRARLRISSRLLRLALSVTGG
jgi:hypothetical protein